METKRQSRTYRVRQLPLHLDHLEVVKLLIKLQPDFGSVENVRLKSLAAGINPWERPQTQMATVMFHKLPDSLDSDGPLWVLPGREYGLRRDVLMDINYLDFTVLHDVSRDHEHLYDCIAISGLASHPFGSWRSRYATDFMWLRDQIPQDFPTLRTITYGLDTRLIDHDSFQTIDDLASSFVNSLRRVGRASPSVKPIIFFAHSLGGVVLKRSLVLLASGSPSDLVILQTIQAIIFFGVPSKGMRTEDLLSVVVHKAASDNIIRSLSLESEYLRILETQYTGISLLQRIRLFSFFETERSALVKLSPAGGLMRSDQLSVLVPRESAIHSHSVAEDIAPINQNHSNMVKFAPGDEGYHQVATWLEKITSIQASAHHESHDKESFTNVVSSLRHSAHLFSSFEVVEGLDDIIPHSWQSLHSSLPKFDSTYSRWLSPNDREAFTDITRRYMALASANLRHAPLGLSRITKGSEQISANRMLHNKSPINSPNNTNYSKFLSEVQQLEATNAKMPFLKKAWHGYIRQIDQLMMQCLYLPDITAREAKIETAHTSTFQWIFKNEATGLVDWIEAQSGIFWVNGKPGSGKSTLMKYLWKENRLHKMLDQNKTQDLIMLKLRFFFSDRGSHFQKSFEGLLQSIIYEILSQEPRLSECVEPIFVRRGAIIRAGVAQGAAWNLTDLEEAFANILAQTKLQIHIFLLLDALDEYSGSKEALSEWIHNMAEGRCSTQAKFSIIFATRPEPIFVTKFRHFSGIKIEDHTAEDVRTFTIAKLESEPDLKSFLSHLDLMQGHAGYSKVVEYITSCANGVFLWVSLTINEILSRWINGFEPKDVWTMLRSLPSGLDDFYKRIISRLPKDYLEDAYVMIETVLRCRETPSLAHFANVIACARSQTFQECLVAYQNSRQTFYKSNVERLVRSKTGGLLECKMTFLESEEDEGSSEQEEGPIEVIQVQFIHQTAQEHFRRPGVLQSLISDSERIRIGNGSIFLFKTHFVMSCYISAQSADQNNMIAPYQIGSEKESNSGGALADYQMQLMLLEQQNQKGLLMKRADILDIENHIESLLRGDVHQSDAPCEFSYNSDDRSPLLFDYGRDAEASTGMSQWRFVKSAPSNVIKAGHFFSQSAPSHFIDENREVFDEGLLRSQRGHLWFAAVAGLELQVREEISHSKFGNATIQTQSLMASPTISLLHLIVATKHFPQPGHATIISLLLTLDPFDLDITRDAPLPRSPRSIPIVQPLSNQLRSLVSQNCDPRELINILSLLFHGGIKANDEIRLKTDAWPTQTPSACSMLHLASIIPEATELLKEPLLSEHNVNRLDDNNLTALDWIVQRAFDVYAFPWSRRTNTHVLNIWRQNATRLKSYGGRVTHEYQSALDILLEGNMLIMLQLKLAWLEHPVKLDRPQGKRKRSDYG